MQKVYEAITTFEEHKNNEWDTTFKVNKTFEIENKVLPRLIANKPKRLVSIRTDTFDEADKDLTPEERSAKLNDLSMYSDAIRDYLTNVFDKQDLDEVTKLWAKA